MLTKMDLFFSSFFWGGGGGGGIYYQKKFDVPKIITFFRPSSMICCLTPAQAQARHRSKIQSLSIIIIINSEISDVASQEKMHITFL